MALPLRFSAQAPSPRLEEILPAGTSRIEELSDTSADSDDEYEDMGVATAEEQANIAYLNSVRIPIRETYQTETTKVQEQTHEVILPFLEGNPNEHALNEKGIPKLQREKHEPTLRNLIGDYPSQFCALDASRPWMVYWVLQSLTALGDEVGGYTER